MEFRQNVKGQKDPWRFLASSMSDGTLRAFGVLLATLQSADKGPLLLGLEEPETAVHPAAAHVLLEALRVAADRRQVLVTSHSPDLLDDPDLDESSLLTVQSFDGITRIGPIDETSRDMLRRSLFTPGELLRQNQIEMSPEAKANPPEAQLAFFEVEGVGS
jgi:predicted ATPase